MTDCSRSTAEIITQTRRPSRWGQYAVGQDSLVKADLLRKVARHELARLLKATIANNDLDNLATVQFCLNVRIVSVEPIYVLRDRLTYFLAIVCTVQDERLDQKSPVRCEYCEVITMRVRAGLKIGKPGEVLAVCNRDNLRKWRGIEFRKNISRLLFDNTDEGFSDVRSRCPVFVQDQQTIGLRPNL